MSKSLIYAGNSNSQPTVATGTTIKFIDLVRRYGNNLKLSGGNVISNGAGYYEGEAKITYTGTGAGLVKFTVFRNGAEIPYANASATTAENVTNTATIPFVSRDVCCCDEIITVVASGAVVNVIDASIKVIKA